VLRVYVLVGVCGVRVRVVYVYMCVCVGGLAVRARASVPVGILQGVRVLSDFGLAGQPRQLRMMRPPLCY